jgi:hypothetical protein
MLELINEVVPGLTLKYNKHYIGLARDGVPDNFVTFRARKDYLIAEFRIARSGEVSASFEDAGIDVLEYDKRWGKYRMRLTGDDLGALRDLMVNLVRQASGAPVVDDDELKT